MTFRSLTLKTSNLYISLHENHNVRAGSSFAVTEFNLDESKNGYPKRSFHSESGLSECRMITKITKILMSLKLVNLCHKRNEDTSHNDWRFWWLPLSLCFMRMTGCDGWACSFLSTLTTWTLLSSRDMQTFVCAKNSYKHPRLSNFHIQFILATPFAVFVFLSENF